MYHSVHFNIQFILQNINNKLKSFIWKHDNIYVGNSLTHFCFYNDRDGSSQDKFYAFKYSHTTIFVTGFTDSSKFDNISHVHFNISKANEVSPKKAWQIECTFNLVTSGFLTCKHQ